MAYALNIFRTVNAVLTTDLADVYTAPEGYSAIILMAQIANVTPDVHEATFAHKSGATVTELIKNFEISGHDAAAATTGKLVVESGHKIQASSSSNNALKLTLSILESANG
jgi:hypothetical protein